MSGFSNSTSAGSDLPARLDNPTGTQSRDLSTSEAEAHIRESEERFRKIFDYSNDAIFVVDPAQDEILDVNPQACKMLGFSRENLLSMRMSAIHPHEMPLLRAFASSVVDKGHGWTNELSCLTKSGQRLPSEISASVIELAGRKCMIALIRDITERKRAEQALRESEERYRQLVEQAGDAIFVSDEQGRIIDVNHRACDSLGYTHRELLAMAIWELNPAKWKPESVKQVMEHLEPGKPLTYESRHRRKDGSTFPVEIRVGRFEAGGRKFNLDLARDITERKRAAEALRESEQRLSRILESAMDAIMTMDKNRHITLFNSAAEKVFRCSAAEAVGQPFDRFLSEPFRNLFGNDDGSIKATRSLWAPEGLTARRADGEEFPIEATISQFEMAGQNFQTVILRDVNDRAKAEAELRRLQLENVYLQEEIKTQYNFEEIVGASSAIKKVFQNVEQVAGTDSTVLLTGETGTGKELIARAIHNLSRRKESVLVKVNCAALSAGLIESELFGHEKGAFTGALSRKIGRFEMADGGTLFLDEIGDLPLDLQAKLLRVLQEGEFERVGSTQTMKVEVRIIAATNRDIEKAVAEGQFRADLFYRLTVFPIHLPPLRERKTDIPLLVRHFVLKYNNRMGKKIAVIPPQTMAALQAYAWPGNVRELENVIERAVIISKGDQLEPGDWLPKRSATSHSLRTPTLEELERKHILAVLETTGWRVSGEKGAAKLLGMKPTTLEARMKKLGIKRKR